jgi:hypothetical protein
MSALTTRVYDQSVRPVLEYWPSAPPDTLVITNFAEGVKFTITGKALRQSDQAVTNATEVITVTSSNDTPSDVIWYQVTGITCTNRPPNSMDAWRLVYKTAFPVYGGSVYRLYACDINERMAALDPLVCTRYALGYGNALNTCLYGQAGAPSAGSYTNWPAAQSTAFTDFSPHGANADGRVLRFGTAGSFDVGNLNSYAANVFGVTQYFTWATMPTALTNKETAATIYLKFSPFFLVAVGTGAGTPGANTSPFDSTQMVFDTFGYYTNMQSGIIHSFAATNAPGANSLGWGELNATNVAAFTTPWCDEPTTYNNLDKTNSRTRGAQFSAHYLHLSHTNWMTKW